MGTDLVAGLVNCAAVTIGGSFLDLPGMSGFLKCRLALYVLALFLFAVLLLAENVFALYFFSLNPLTRQWLEAAATTAQIAMVLLRLLETSALALLTWAMWQ